MSNKHNISNEELERLLKQDEKLKSTYKRINTYQKEKYDRIVLTPAKGTRDIWKTYAELEGKSVNAFLVDIIEAYISEHYNE